MYVSVTVAVRAVLSWFGSQLKGTALLAAVPSESHVSVVLAVSVPADVGSLLMVYSISPAVAS